MYRLLRGIIRYCAGCKGGDDDDDCDDDDDDDNGKGTLAAQVVAAMQCVTCLLCLYAQ